MRDASTGASPGAGAPALAPWWARRGVLGAAGAGAPPVHVVHVAPPRLGAPRDRVTLVLRAFL